jgi:hypothetical protein
LAARQRRGRSRRERSNPTGCGGLAYAIPVQAPIKLELAINLKTAKAFGITVSPNLLVQAEQVIE